MFTVVYIPLCLYFNLSRGSACLIPFSVYIPLCLYFNLNYFCLLVFVMFSFTFHYVSILIFRLWYLTLPFFYVYIPLCLYFNLCVLSEALGFVIVYIPLCLYFNKVIIILAKFSIEVYIPLCLYFNHHSRPESSGCFQGLHSIMSLF